MLSVASFLNSGATEDLLLTGILIIDLLFSSFNGLLSESFLEGIMLLVDYVLNDPRMSRANCILRKRLCRNL